MSRKYTHAAVATAVQVVLSDSLKHELDSVDKVEQDVASRATLIILTSGQRFRVTVAEEQ